MTVPTPTQRLFLVAMLCDELRAAISRWKTFGKGLGGFIVSNSAIEG